MVLLLGPGAVIFWLVGGDEPLAVFLLTSKANFNLNSSFFLVFSCCSASSLLSAKASLS